MHEPVSPSVSSTSSTDEHSLRRDSVIVEVTSSDEEVSSEEEVVDAGEVSTPKKPNALSMEKLLKMTRYLAQGKKLNKGFYFFEKILNTLGGVDREAYAKQLGAVMNSLFLAPLVSVDAASKTPKKASLPRQKKIVKKSSEFKKEKADSAAMRDEVFAAMQIFSYWRILSKTAEHEGKAALSKSIDAFSHRNAKRSMHNLAKAAEMNMIGEKLTKPGYSLLNIEEADAEDTHGNLTDVYYQQRIKESKTVVYVRAEVKCTSVDLKDNISSRIRQMIMSAECQHKNRLNDEYDKQNTLALPTWHKTVIVMHGDTNWPGTTTSFDALLELVQAVEKQVTDLLKNDGPVGKGPLLPTGENYKKLQRVYQQRFSTEAIPDDRALGRSLLVTERITFIWCRPNGSRDKLSVDLVLDKNNKPLFKVIKKPKFSFTHGMETSLAKKLLVVHAYQHRFSWSLFDRNAQRSTVLHEAILANNNSLALFYLNNRHGDMLLMMEDNKENIPLHIACRKGNILIVEKIFSLNADFFAKQLNIKNGDKMTPFDLACINNCEKIIQFLVENEDLSQKKLKYFSEKYSKNDLAKKIIDNKLKKISKKEKNKTKSYDNKKMSVAKKIS